MLSHGDLSWVHLVVTTSEESVRAMVNEDEVPEAVARAFDLYADEVFGFLVGALDDAHAARDVYGVMSERVRGGLAAFSWSFSLRIWMYAIAWGALSARLAQRAASRIGAAPTPCPRSTKHSTVRPRGPADETVTALRSALSVADRALLILRVGRGFDWRSLALVWLEGESAPLEIEREAARLADRFTHVRRELSRAALDDTTSLWE